MFSLQIKILIGLWSLAFGKTQFQMQNRMPPYYGDLDPSASRNFPTSRFRLRNERVSFLFSLSCCPLHFCFCFNFVKIFLCLLVFFCDEYVLKQEIFFFRFCNLTSQNQFFLLIRTSMKMPMTLLVIILSTLNMLIRNNLIY